MVNPITGLLDFFLDEASDTRLVSEMRAQRTSDGATDRELLAAVLTTRAPLPIPTDVLDRLELLLAAQRETRGVVEATVLPSLADEGVELPGFPAHRVALWRGDLTRLRADAIVNAANNRMLGCFVPGHACIDNAIHAAAGPRLRDECAGHMRQQGFPEPTGRAVITSGYQLPSSHVIHTVGPIVGTEITSDHKEHLANSYISVLDAAETHGGIATVGLCSVSTGVFGFPKELAAPICLDTIAGWFAAHPGSRLRVVISLFSDIDVAAYRNALNLMAAA